MGGPHEIPGPRSPQRSPRWRRPFGGSAGRRWRRLRCSVDESCVDGGGCGGAEVVDQLLAQVPGDLAPIRTARESAEQRAPKAVVLIRRPPNLLPEWLVIAGVDPYRVPVVEQVPQLQQRRPNPSSAAGSSTHPGRLRAHRWSGADARPRRPHRRPRPTHHHALRARPQKPSTDTPTTSSPPTWPPAPNPVFLSCRNAEVCLLGTVDDRTVERICNPGGVDTDSDSAPLAGAVAAWDWRGVDLGRNAPHGLCSMLLVTRSVEWLDHDSGEVP
jgi:hypothetical protein